MTIHLIKIELDWIIRLNILNNSKEKKFSVKSSCESLESHISENLLTRKSYCEKKQKHLHFLWRLIFGEKEFGSFLLFIFVNLIFYITLVLIFPAKPVTIFVQADFSQFRTEFAKEKKKKKDRMQISPLRCVLFFIASNWIEFYFQS